QLRRAFANDSRQGHAIETARGRGGGRVEISVAVEPEEVEMLIVAARTGEQRDGLDTVASEDKNQAAGLGGRLGARLQIVESGDDFRDVAGTLVIVVIGEETRRAIAEVCDFIADGLESFDEAGSAKCGRRLFGAGSEAGRAGGRANQGNFTGLTDDFDRQGTLLFFLLLWLPRAPEKHPGNCPCPAMQKPCAQEARAN